MLRTLAAAVRSTTREANQGALALAFLAFALLPLLALLALAAGHDFGWEEASASVTIARHRSRLEKPAALSDQGGLQRGEVA